MTETGAVLGPRISRTRGRIVRRTSGTSSTTISIVAVPYNEGFVNALCVLAGVLAYILLVERIGFLIMGALVIFVTETRDAQRGLWADRRPVPPWEYRAHRVSLRLRPWGDPVEGASGERWISSGQYNV